MNIKPIFKNRVDKRTNLHIGVEIRYETHDAEALMHMLEFIKSEEAKCGAGFLMPKAYLSGSAITIEAIIKSLNEFTPGERSINGVVSLCFLDEMRRLFEAYLALLDQLKKESLQRFEWDEDHPFHPVHMHYLKIAELYFPPQGKMN